MTRRVLSVVVGAVAAFAVMLLLEGLISWLYPLPPGTDVRDAQVMREIIAGLPWWVMALLLVAWLAAVTVGGEVARWIDRSGSGVPAILVGAIVLASATYEMVTLPHPAWFIPAALVGIVVATAFSARGRRPTRTVHA